MGIIKKYLRLIVIVAVLGIICLIISFTPAYKRRFHNKYAHVDNKVGLIWKTSDRTADLAHDILIKDNRILLSYDDMNKFIDAYIYKDEKYNQIISTSKTNVIYIDYQINKMRNILSDDWKDIYIHLENDVMYFDINELEDIYGIDVEYIKETNLVTIKKDIHTYKIGEVAIKSKLKIYPSSISGTIDKLEANEKVYVLKEDKEYYQILDTKGRFGYIKQADITNINDVTNYVEKTYDKPINLSWDYVYSQTPDRSMEMPIEGVNIMSPTWYELVEKNTEIKSKVDEEYISWARENGYDLWVLVSNEGRIETTHNILNDSKLREKIINDLITEYTKYGFDGINVDFENMYKEDAIMYAQFIRELAVVFRNNNIFVSVDITVPDGSETWSLCYDRDALSEAADYLVLMGYDQTNGSSQKPGSVAACNWVEANLIKLRDNEAVRMDKLILGLPFYTRIWTTKSTGVTSSTIDMKDIDNYIVKNGLTKQWLENEKQNYVEFERNGNKVQMWIEDIESIEEKLKLVEKFNLAGVASWEKDREDARVWALINSYLSK
ncbi:MAG: hypothetical protein E7311_02210 [Clostridiales bacterium]|nr:hypothetical protein [Clostridiales bacterium]